MVFQVIMFVYEGPLLMEAEISLQKGIQKMIMIAYFLDYIEEWSNVNNWLRDIIETELYDGTCNDRAF